MAFNETCMTSETKIALTQGCGTFFVLKLHSIINRQWSTVSTEYTKVTNFGL